MSFGEHMDPLTASLVIRDSRSTDNLFLERSNSDGGIDSFKLSPSELKELQFWLNGHLIEKTITVIEWEPGW